MAASIVIPGMFVTMSAFCDVPAKVLYSVAQVESRAHPWTLNIQGKGLFFDTRDEMYDVLMLAISEGRSVDIGIAQLNWHWKQAYTQSAWQLTDPTYNLNVACRIIHEHYQTHGDWFTAVGYYHREAQRPKDEKARAYYSGKVRKAYQGLSHE